MLTMGCCWEGLAEWLSGNNVPMWGAVLALLIQMGGGPLVAMVTCGGSVGGGAGECHYQEL